MVAGTLRASIAQQGPEGERVSSEPVAAAPSVPPEVSTRILLHQVVLVPRPLVTAVLGVGGMVAGTLLASIAQQGPEGEGVPSEQVAATSSVSLEVSARTLLPMVALVPWPLVTAVLGGKMVAGTSLASIAQQALKGQREFLEPVAAAPLVPPEI